MIRVGIVGSAGYTGGELLRVLIYHPEVEIVFANSASNAGNKVYAVHNDLFGDTELTFFCRFSLRYRCSVSMCRTWGCP